MKNAIIIHGMPDKEEYDRVEGSLKALGHWIIWLQKALVKKGVDAVVPAMPVPYEPKYEAWKNTFEQYDITPETILVGHSCGAGFLVRWLSENKNQVGKVVLVAPWVDPTKEYTTEMFDAFTIDPELVARCKEFTVVYSLDDDQGVIITVDELKAALPAGQFKEFSGKGHFTFDDMGTHEFPEILTILGF